MFTGVDFKKAVKYWEQGREVIVLDRASKSVSGSGYDTFDFAQLFENVEFLADVPAVEHPILEQESDITKPEDTEEVTPPPEKPEEKVIFPAGKTNKEIALDLAGQGLTATEIARHTGMKYGTVYYYLNQDKKPAVASGHNSDRHLCKSCKYRSSEQSKKHGCDYIDVVGHSRGCEVEECSVYEKGNPVSKRKRAGFYQR
ncbi:MAG: hypothetical protein QM793_06680 [Muricomes sp.]